VRGGRRDRTSRDIGDRCGLFGGPRRFRPQDLDYFAPRGDIVYAHKLASFKPPVYESVKAAMRVISR
jgi:hypothetical protein